MFLCGNGGSYANAMHLANDLLASGIKAHTLDPASLTASANDHGYASVFERWINVVGSEGDLLVALSGSGASENVVRAIEAAKANGMLTCAIVGAWQDKQPIACTLADFHLRLGHDMQGAEEMQLVIGHQILKELKARR